MERLDLNSVQGRLALVDRVFTYPIEPHRRKHGPHGYERYEIYRDWLRDEFSYRCVFTLFRETWPGFEFHIDHLISQIERRDLICEYDNLIWVEQWINLRKGKRRVADPCEVALSECLFVHIHGEKIGQIEAKNDVGSRIIRVLKLDHRIPTGKRRKMLEILRSVAQTNEPLFRELMGYPKPEDLPNLIRRRPPENSRRDGLEKSARSLHDRGLLPEWI